MDASSARQQLREAVNHAKQGNKSEAINIVLDILKNDQSNADGWILMAQLVDDPAKALDCWRRAATLKPDDMRIRANIAKLEAFNQESEFSPYLDGIEVSNNPVPVQQRGVASKTGTKGQGCAGCIAPILLTLIVIALLGMLGAVYLNRTSPGWLSGYIYDRQAASAVGNLVDAFGEVTDSFPDSDRIAGGDYHPYTSSMLPAIAALGAASDQVLQLNTPEARAQLYPSVSGAGAACKAAVPALQIYLDNPSMRTINQALDALGPCSHAIDAALGHLGVQMQVGK
jgi:hypothetical protein